MLGTTNLPRPYWCDPRPMKPLPQMVYLVVFYYTGIQNLGPGWVLESGGCIIGEILQAQKDTQSSPFHIISGLFIFLLLFYVISHLPTTWNLAMHHASCAENLVPDGCPLPPDVHVSGQVMHWSIGSMCFSPKGRSVNGAVYFF